MRADAPRRDIAQCCAHPGVPGLLFVGFLARGPVIAVSAVLTLHVVLTLHLQLRAAPGWSRPP